ncbi:MAG TPA: hypothetical protein VN612_01215 [Acidobacteriaceae bacterium]|nr:hypothetical protein [Acidobacteriaceae bacterium]
MRTIAIFLALTLFVRNAPAQAATDKPLPDIPSLLRDVEANQRKAEAVEKDYIYHSVLTEEHLDSRGNVKKRTTTEADHFWLNGVPVMRVVKKDGRPLSADELAKEDRKIDSEAAKARDRRAHADSSGKETGPHGEDEVTVSRLLELGKFTNPRRVQINGRDTIAVDFTGDPTAKTRNRLEDMIHDLAGTAWIDEQDHVLARTEGRFTNTFKVGFGLVANIRQGTHFTAQWTKVNDEVWLLANAEGEGSARVLLFWNFDGRATVSDSDYRKFRATSTVLPATASPSTPSPPIGHSPQHQP